MHLKVGQPPGARVVLRGAPAAERDICEHKTGAELIRCIEAAARSDENLMPHVLHAVERYATVGEISHRLRSVWGEYGG